MRMCKFSIFIFVSIYLYLVESKFPSCENVVPVIDGSPSCAYCSSERVRKECKDLCDKQCQPKPTPDNSAHGNGNGNGNGDGNSNAGSGSSSSCNNIDPCVEKKEANKKFLANCKKNGIQDTCLPYCRYDATKRELQDAFQHGKCDLDEARDLLRSAANGKNNVYCCKKKHVLDGGNSICEPFCNPDSDSWPQGDYMKYLRCQTQFDNMMTCHWAAQRP